MSGPPQIPEDVESFLAFANASMALRSGPGCKHLYYPLRVVGFPKDRPEVYRLRGPPTPSAPFGLVLLRITARDRLVYAGRRSTHPLCHLSHAPTTLQLFPDSYIDPREHVPHRVPRSPLVRSDGSSLRVDDILVYRSGRDGGHAFLQVEKVCDKSIVVRRRRRTVQPDGSVLPSCVYGRSYAAFRIRRDGLVPAYIADAQGCMAEPYDPCKTYTDTEVRV